MDPKNPTGEPADRWGADADTAATTARAQELRATLDAVVSEAERVSEQLIGESRATAAATTREADERASEILDQARAAADAIRAQAETDVEDHRRRVRAEVAELVRAEVEEQNRMELAGVRAQAQAVIGDLEASVRILGVSLEAAVANIAEMLSALEELRSHTVDPMPTAPRSTAVDPHPDPLLGPMPDEQLDQETTSFGRPVPPRSVPAALSAFDEAGSEAVGKPTLEGESEPAPLTATEAFLRSSRLEEDPASTPDLHAVPSEDDPSAEAVGVVRAIDRERDPERDEADGSDEARPLGWLFRSPQ